MRIHLVALSLYALLVSVLLVSCVAGPPVDSTPTAEPPAAPMVPRSPVGHQEMLESYHYWPAPQDPLPHVAALPPELAYIDDLPQPESIGGSAWRPRETYCEDRIAARLAVGLAGPQDRRYCYAFYNAVLAGYDAASDGEDWTAESCIVARSVFFQSLEHYLPGFMTRYEAMLPWVKLCRLPGGVGYLIDGSDYIGDHVPDWDVYRKSWFYKARGDACINALRGVQRDNFGMGSVVRRALDMCYVGFVGALAYELAVTNGGSHADGCREGRRAFLDVWDFHLPHAPEGADAVWMRLMFPDDICSGEGELSYDGRGDAGWPIDLTSGAGFSL